MIRYCDEYWEDISNVLLHIQRLDELAGHSILITGGTGMICSTIVDILFYLNRCKDAGIRIILGGRSTERARARFNGFVEGKDYFFLPFDVAAQVFEVQRIQDVGADYIIHGASNADPTAIAAEPVETILANVFGLHSILEAASRCGTKRLLYISSSEVYGNSLNQNDKQSTPALGESVSCTMLEKSYGEEDYGYVNILNPRASYPCSKRVAETLCIAYEKERGLDTVIVRPGHIYGPSITDYDSRASAQFIRDAAAGKDIVMKSAGTQLRSYCYTLDCASAILIVLLNGERSNAYNISNRESVVTIRDVAEAFAKAGGTKVIFEESSDREKASYNLMTNSSLNSEKLENLGWKAIFDLEKGSRKTLEFFR